MQAVPPLRHATGGQACPHDPSPGHAPAWEQLAGDLGIAAAAPSAAGTAACRKRDATLGAAAD